ncbi:MAG: hypothetical protein ACK5MY_02705 [Jhaorihella sp.]
MTTDKVTLSKTDYAKLVNRIKELEAAAPTPNPIDDITLLADMAYRSLNSAALATNADEEMGGGDGAGEIRPHLPVRHAIERVLDGVYEAINGVTPRDGGAKKQWQYGLTDRIDNYQRILAEIMSTEGKLFTDQGQAVNERAGRIYHRWAEVSQLVATLERMQDDLVTAYDNADTADGEGWKPRDERLDDWRAKKAKREEDVAKVAEQMKEALKVAPPLFPEVKRSA